MTKQQTLPAVAEPAAAPLTPALVEAAEPTAQQELVGASSSDGNWKQALAILEDRNSNPLAAYLDPNTKNPLWGLATMFSKSQWVPATFQGKPADCLIGLHLAGRLRVDPLAVLQSAYVVHGRPGFEAKFLINLANERGPFAHEIRYRFEGPKPKAGAEPSEEFAVTAYARYPDGEIAEATVSIGTAKAEGWYGRNPKYRTMPEQMLCYRAASMLIRRCCPHVTMGFLTRDELEETVADADVVSVTNPNAAAAQADKVAGKVETVRAKVDALKQGQPAPAGVVA